ncbi:hypothetical protein SOCE26_027530 [Sorangium cellulosum]|uniref:Uncharacterized protein n=1 Tax=Sorangium cellulosum TaxID=56 RepID=A0A2L0EPV4_SORCE|nr:hypothetical protein [Sorangium cellulosum]AUX41343.1 hypothetical protein SOCE26_027530 [Sorangium cellulosum]
MKPRQPADPRSSPAGDGAAPRRAGPDRDRRLALVAPGSAPAAPAAPEVDPFAPASDDELRAARALAEALEQGEVPLAAALQAAARPVGLDRADHEALLARALGDLRDEDAPPTKAEQRAADRLREALERGASGEGAPGRGAGAGGEGDLGARDELAELAGALRAAWRPAPLAELRGRALVERALGAPSEQRSRRAAPITRRIAPITMAALSTLAAAAAVAALMFGEIRDERASVARAPAAPGAALAPLPSLVEARSTAALFDPAAPFPREGGQTARIDRITAARAADLRQNRYAAWGVR